MRRGRKKFAEDDAAVDMTPMLDIVFILLIFFIVTATFLNETGLDFTRPPDSDTPPTNSQPKPAIVVYVDEQNLCSVDGVSAECTDVAVTVEGLLSSKPGATIILRINGASDHFVQTMLKDVFDSRNMNVKFEPIRNTGQAG